VSYLPDLQPYLDDLLRSRERLLAAGELDEWAKADALPSEEEITRIRRLIFAGWRAVPCLKRVPRAS
jgi:hypothetical protein